MKEVGIKNISDFPNWDDANEEDFFALSEQEDVVSQDDDIIKSPTEAEQDPQEDDDLEDDSTGEDSTEDQEEQDDNEEQEEDLFSSGELLEEDDEVETSPGFLESFVEIAKAKGYLPEDEKFEGEEDDIEVLFEEKIEKIVNAQVEDLISELPDPVKKLTKYVLDGGDFNKFIDNIVQAKATLSGEDFDIDDEKHQENFLREVFMEQGDDFEEATSKVEYYKEKGKLDSIARKNYDKKQEEKKEAEKKLIAKQKKQKEERVKAIRENKKSLYGILRTEKTIGDIPILPVDKNIPEYVTNPKYKGSNGEVYTELQKDLIESTFRNPKALMQLAILLKDRNEDGTFNFERVVKKASSDSVNKIKDEIRKSKNASLKSSSKKRKGQQTRMLADYI